MCYSVVLRLQSRSLAMSQRSSGEVAAACVLRE